MLAAGPELRGVLVREDVALQIGEVDGLGAVAAHPSGRADLVGYEGCPDGGSAWLPRTRLGMEGYSCGFGGDKVSEAGIGERKRHLPLQMAFQDRGLQPNTAGIAVFEQTETVFVVVVND